MLLIPSLLCLAAASPQERGGGCYLPEWKYEKEYAYSHELMPLPDVNGDGFSDFLYLSPLASPYFSQQGSIQAISGVDGSLIWEELGPEAGDRFGNYQPELLDLNNDGRLDVFFDNVAGSMRRIYAIDAASGQLIWEYEAEGKEVDVTSDAWVGDIDGDGFNEILHAADSNGDLAPKNLYCRSNSGDEIWRYDRGERASFQHVIDLDGDGRLEVVVATQRAKILGLQDAGRIVVLDAQTGSPKWEQFGSLEDQELGREIQFTDLTGDGVLDLLAPCPYTPNNNLPEAGGVWAYDGINGNELWHVIGPAKGGRLGSILAVADIDQNGADDVILGTPFKRSGSGQVSAINGADGSLLWRALGPSGLAEGFGQSIYLEDFDSDGSLDLLVESSSFGPDGYQMEQAKWSMHQASDGTQLWQLLTGDTYRYPPNFRIEDLNNDGISEFLQYSHYWYRDGGPQKVDAGIVHTFSAAGTPLWRREGVGNHQAYGWIVNTADFDNDGIDDLLINGIGSDTWFSLSVGMIEVKSGISGDVIWSREGTVTSQYFGREPHLVDLNQDGTVDIVSGSSWAPGWDGSQQGELNVLDGITGSTVFTKAGTAQNHRYPSLIMPIDDIDQDGWKNLIVVGHESMANLSGNGNFQEFMSASSNQLSASSGGSILLDLDFTPLAKWNEYLVLASGSSPGTNFHLGLPVPLEVDEWFHKSKAAELSPRLFRNFHGVLDDYGTAQAEIRFGPGEIPSAAVGSTATFAAVSKLPWGAWEYCSIPQAITLVP